ncbi:DAO-domain-containing protein, partial [Gymnopus androsaceus JB14]
GVIGLSTAISILESSKPDRSYRVTILASRLPTDAKSIEYTSHWAGAHHSLRCRRQFNVVFVGTSEQLQIDQETFNTMWALANPENVESEKCFLKVEQTEYYQDEIPEGKEHHLKWYPDFRILPPTSLTPDLRSQGVQSGVMFTTLTIDIKVYLCYLLSRFEKAGGTVVKGTISHLRDVQTQIESPVDAIVNCTGLGSLSLGGVQDSAMYPLRGQTVLLRAPWIRFGRTISSRDGLWTYIIPRRSGDVIVGGIKVAHDFHPSPRPETTLDILNRALKLCPELVPSEAALIDDNPHPHPSLIDLVKPIIIEEGCGLRPAREGGIRLETQWVDVAAASELKHIPLVHNYGHSGSGFQSSWGSAYRAARLLEKALSNS